MNTVMIELPLDALASPGALPEHLASEAKFMLALNLFEVGSLSSGKAGRPCGHETSGISPRCPARRCARRDTR